MGHTAFLPWAAAGARTCPRPARGWWGGALPGPLCWGHSEVPKETEPADNRTAHLGVGQGLTRLHGYHRGQSSSSILGREARDGGDRAGCDFLCRQGAPGGQSASPLATPTQLTS